ncbi:MAG: hypothetical protein ACXV98_16035 [Ilumatobacteraceae bacterium]
MAKLAGWYTDPSRRHQLRYRDDSQWTKWAADADDLVEDPDGVSASTAAITRRHRRGWVIAAVAATIGGLILVGCITLINHAELRGTSEVVAEMNGWKLPPSVARSSRADHIERGNLTDASPSVTRWFDPVGTTPTEAILDLVASLQAQGY